MKIAMTGTGLVGLVPEGCFSDFRYDVICVEKGPPSSQNRMYAKCLFMSLASKN